MKYNVLDHRAKFVGELLSRVNDAIRRSEDKVDSEGAFLCGCYRSTACSEDKHRSRSGQKTLNKILAFKKIYSMTRRNLSLTL